MNLFARGFGGFVSDVANAMLGMNGRLIWQSLSLLIEGLLIILFSNMNSLSLAIIMMTLFSIFVQASEGSTFGIVPYVHPPVTGSIAGIVGAMGSAGKQVNIFPLYLCHCPLVLIIVFLNEVPWVSE